MLLSAAVILITVALAMNVGANNSAAEMGPAYGAGVRSKREAVFLIAVFAMLGAVLAGGRVVGTLSGGIVPRQLLASHLDAVLVIVISATGIILLANLIRIPIATAHAMVGAVIGMGLYYGSVDWHRVIGIVGWWLVTPVASLAISYALGRLAYRPLAAALAAIPDQQTSQRVMKVIITLSGCYMAFSAGSNSLAKSVGPLVGSGVLGSSEASIMGGLAMSGGALLLGSRLLETVGKGITSLCPVSAILVEIVSASIVFVASRFGMPVSLAEIVTCAVIGFSCAHAGVSRTANNRHVRKIYALWPACPGLSAGLCFGMATLMKVAR